MRKAALEALLAHRYAAEDVVRSSAWPSYCQALGSVLADADQEVAERAAAFAEQVYTEVRITCAQQLAELCMALAHFTAACSERQQPEQPTPGQLERSRSTSGTARACNPSLGRGAAAAADRDASMRRRVAALLMKCLRVLPRVWATFKPDLMQRLWHSVCPLLRLSQEQGLNMPHCSAVASRECSSIVASKPCSSAPLSTPCQMQASRCTILATAAADKQPQAESCQNKGTAATRHVAQRASCSHGENRWKLLGPLVQLCALPEWDSDWWRGWTAPAMSARVICTALLPFFYTEGCEGG